MALYLSPRYGFIANSDADFEELDARSEEVNKWIQDPANGVPAADKLRLHRQGMDDGEYGYALTFDLAQWSTAVYSGEVFFEDALVRPFQLPDGQPIESQEEAIKEALQKIRAAYPDLNELAWTEEPQRFFGVTS